MWTTYCLNFYIIYIIIYGSAISLLSVVDFNQTDNIVKDIFCEVLIWILSRKTGI